MKNIGWFSVLLLAFIITLVLVLTCVSRAAVNNLLTGPYGYNYNISTRYSIYNALGSSQYSDYLKIAEQIYNPYVLSPLSLFPTGVFGLTYMPYAYDTGFLTYTGQLDVGTSYSKSLFGLYSYYNSASASVNKDVYTWGYPFPYAQLTKADWDISQSSGTIALFGSDYLYSIINKGYLSNLYYNPTAFTLDLGLSAYNQGIINFWQGIINKSKENK